MCIRNRIIKPLWAGRPRILRVGGVLGSGVRINTCGSRPLAGQWDAVIQREVCCSPHPVALVSSGPGASKGRQRNLPCLASNFVHLTSQSKRGECTMDATQEKTTRKIDSESDPIFRSSDRVQQQPPTSHASSQK